MTLQRKLSRRERVKKKDCFPNTLTHARIKREVKARRMLQDVRELHGWADRGGPLTRQVAVGTRLEHRLGLKLTRRDPGGFGRAYGPRGHAKHALAALAQSRVPR